MWVKVFIDVFSHYIYVLALYSSLVSVFTVCRTMLSVICNVTDQIISALDYTPAHIWCMVFFLTAA